MSMGLVLAVFLFRGVGAAAATDLTWTGNAPLGSPSWSLSANWGGATPSGTGENLIFPTLSPACNPFTATCNRSVNDLSSLDIGGLTLGCGAYDISGNSITLGGGLTASCVGGSTTSNHWKVPLTLTADQTWRVEGDTTFDTSLWLDSNVSGSPHRLGIELINNGFLDLTGDVETGPVTVTSIGQGDLGLAGGRLNATDGSPVTLNNAAMTGGGGTIGPLTSMRSVIAPGTLMIAGDATFDSASTLRLSIEGGGTASQISATGSISFNSTTLSLDAGAQEFCPQAGQQLLLVSASGGLSGRFVSLPNGATTQVQCQGVTSTVRLNYSATSITATVLGASPPPPFNPGSCNRPRLVSAKSPPGCSECLPRR